MRKRLSDVLSGIIDQIVVVDNDKSKYNGLIGKVHGFSGNENKVIVVCDMLDTKCKKTRTLKFKPEELILY